MSMYGTDFAYAYSRLNRTVVRILKTGVPVQVLGINPEGMVTCQELKEGVRFKTHLDTLNLEPVPLGWCNYPNDNARYICRKPMRRDWRQGLRNNSIYIFGGLIGEEIGWKDLHNCIMGIYPTLKEILAAPTNVKRAWCRKWAICGDVLYYSMDTPVGEVREGNLILAPKFGFLREDLEENT